MRDQEHVQLWKTVAARRIFFGHQSVGGNILAGVGELARENPDIGLRIVAGSQASDLKEPAIAHAAIGNNEDPQFKIRAFVEAVDRGVGGVADIAGMKFCYVDITSGTDIEKLFAAYRDAMAGIQARYPNLTLMHFTAPLTRIESPLKSFVKKILGKPLSGKLGNAKRNEYNSLLINYYRGKEPVFDLAAAESTTPEGTTESYSYAGSKYPVLFSKYTDDGGHLNALGRRIVGAKFLEALGAIEVRQH